MNDRRIYRLAGICSLATIAVFFIEFPLYLVRGTFPPITESSRLAEFAARNATNIMACLLMDLVILTLFMVFAAGFCHLIRRADAQLEWLATLFFGVALVYVSLTLIADSLQAATVVDALTVPANPIIIRAMMESMYLMYGSVALFLMAVMTAIAGFSTIVGNALPKWSGWVGYVCALVCLAFVPSLFVGHPDPTAFYNPAGWGPLAFAAGFPLAAWMIVVGFLMIRKSRSSAPFTQR